MPDPARTEPATPLLDEIRAAIETRPKPEAIFVSASHLAQLDLEIVGNGHCASATPGHAAQRSRRWVDGARMSIVGVPVFLDDGRPDLCSPRFLFGGTTAPVVVVGADFTADPRARREQAEQLIAEAAIRHCVEQVNATGRGYPPANEAADTDDTPAVVQGFWPGDLVRVRDIPTAEYTVAARHASGWIRMTNGLQWKAHALELVKTAGGGPDTPPLPVATASQDAAVSTPTHGARIAEQLLSPLLDQRVKRDDEFSRGWNAACAAVRSALQDHARR